MAAAYATLADLPDEFSAVDSDVRQAALDEAEQQVGLSAWGTSASTGHSLLASHILKADGYGTNGSAGAQRRREKVGDVEVEYAIGNSGSAGQNLGSTSYGRRYLRLRTSVVAGGPWVA